MLSTNTAIVLDLPCCSVDPAVAVYLSAAATRCRPATALFPFCQAEGLDQTRGWFYTLMVLSTALFDRPAFKNLVCNGLVLAADGKKMSKRLKNYPVSGAAGGVGVLPAWFGVRGTAPGVLHWCGRDESA